MQIVRALALLTLLVAGCGDNLVPGGAAYNAPAGTASVGGSQVARSKSFLLVTAVAASPQPASGNSTVTMKSGLGGQ